jgi:hypothetical protein
MDPPAIQDPKHQIRNPKQVRISQTAEDPKHGARMAVFDFEHWKFGFASVCGIRTSDFPGAAC